MIAALYVQTGGCYYGLPDVDPWDEERDARLYAGPWPVVAHPPCNRWCLMAGHAHKVNGAPPPGEDGGTFAAALESVRLHGGVIEHPRWSRAFEAHGIATPPPEGWQMDLCGGWTCTVDQRNYGHMVRKPTWLYVYGSTPPQIRWGDGSPSHTTVQRLSRQQRIRTPQPFRDLLPDMARQAA